MSEIDPRYVDNLEKIIVRLNSQLDASMHKEVAMFIELERERKEVVYLEELVAEERERAALMENGRKLHVEDLLSQLNKERARKEWCLESDATRTREYLHYWVHNGTELRTVKITNGDINAAIDAAMKGQSNG